MSSSYLEEQVLKVDLLLDIMEGEHLLSRRELAGSPSGPGGGYSRCSASPVCYGPSCPSCGGSGWVKTRNGRFDPYIMEEVEIASPVRDTSPPEIRAGELTDENRTSILERGWANRNLEPPATREPATLSKVEHKAASSVLPRLRRSLDMMSTLMLSAPEAVAQAALRRERDGLEWFAKRLPRNAWVPGL